VAIHTLSICTGGTAGLDLGLEISLGECRPICYVEIEITAVQTLVSRIREGSLPDAPIFSDLSRFNGKRLRGLVDIVSAGLPCQPYSVAGKRKEHKDKRAIWPEFIRVVGEVLPSLVFLENVPEFLKHFNPVGKELQRMGYVVEEPLFLSASDVGASHKRTRIFILAYRECVGKSWLQSLCLRGSSDPTALGIGGEELAISTIRGRGELRQPSGSDGLTDGRNGLVGNTEYAERGTEHEEHGNASRGTGPGWSSQAVDNSASTRSTGRQSEPGQEIWDEARRSESSGRCDAVGNAECSRADTNSEGCPSTPSTSDQARDFFAPGPSSELWRDILEHAPWLAPAIESGFRVLVDGTPLVLDESRTDQLRSVGNAVVPLQAAVAFTLLVRKASEGAR